MRRLFIEVNPFHAQPLFTLYTNFSRDSMDVVFGHPRLFNQPLFAGLPGQKRRASVPAILRTMMARDVERCYFNTINPILTPFNAETVGLWLSTLVVALGGRLCGKPLAAIAHDADQFFDTGMHSGRRALWFRRAVGRWFIRLFDDVYVLTPEVSAFLKERGLAVKLLDASSLRAFARGAARSDHAAARCIAWIGPVEGFRRSWTTLLDLDPTRLRASDVRIVMICDGRQAEAPRLREELNRRGLMPFFRFFDYRPDDNELMQHAADSAGVLCLYGSPEYGRVKSSGARIISFGLGKPFISATPQLGVYASDGALIRAYPSLTDCLCALTKASGG